LKIGADDYVCKPFDEGELLARVEAMLRIKGLHDHVARARAKLERLSVHDDLTGLFNYRYLHNRLSEEFKRAERYHDPLACIVVDIDRLQTINDLGGRDVGDRILSAVAEVLLRSVRDVDVVTRFGGDEFLVILPSTHFAGSVTVAERIWREVGEASFCIADEQQVKVTLSLGVSLFPSRDVRSKDALLRAADAALNQAKRDGGNRLCVFQQQGYLYTPMAGTPAFEVTATTGETHVASNELPQNLPLFDPQREAVLTMRPRSASSPQRTEVGFLGNQAPSELKTDDTSPGSGRRNNS
jgi:diguanylate cyclase (GGDEF)-like protein